VEEVFDLIEEGVKKRNKKELGQNKKEGVLLDIKLILRSPLYSYTLTTKYQK